MFRLVLATMIACLAPLALAQGPAAGAASSADRVAAGKVVVVEGDVRIYDDVRRERRPKLGDAVYEGDNVFTGGDGEVHFSMADGAYIGVRANTKMRIATYRADGGPDDRSIISLLEGSFRTVTGWIGKLGAKSYQINTPTVTIGVRGTDHEPRVIPEGSAEGEPGTYDRVNAGETVMQSAHGTVSVQANKAGFTPLRGAGPPRVLDRIPAFFRATRNERRFQGLHARTQQRLETLRQQRIHQLQERRRPAATPREQRRGELRKDRQERDLRQQEHREQRERAPENRLEQRRELRERERRSSGERGPRGRERELRRTRAD